MLRITMYKSSEVSRAEPSTMLMSQALGVVSADDAMTERYCVLGGYIQSNYHTRSPGYPGGGDLLWSSTSRGGVASMWSPRELTQPYTWTNDLTSARGAYITQPYTWSRRFHKRTWSLHYDKLKPLN